MKCIEFSDEEKHIKDFLSLPKRLYSRKNNTEDSSNVRSILTGTHTLSKYFKIRKFLVYDNDRAVARFCITTYPDDSTAYFGFFECVKDDTVAECVFSKAEQIARKMHCKKIVGPVDASFWIKYRLKINKFNVAPYAGEPYNLDYYLQYFIDNGYKICDHYTSNSYGAAEREYINKEYEKVYQAAAKKGYIIQNANMKNFNESIKDIYRLIMALYSDFPMFKKLSEEDFCKTFNSYKKIIKPEMVKLAYKNDEMVGFFISVPNYSNLVYHLNVINILRILGIRKNPPEYVMLYMGVDHEHHGLGRAIIYSVIQQLNLSGKTSIGALMHDGKVTQKYAADMINDVYEYALLQKELK